MTVAAMENAMHKLHGLTNAIYWFDVKKLYISSKNKELNVYGKRHAVKLGVFVDSCMNIEDYIICGGGTSDEDVFKMSHIGQVLLNRKEQETLGWPESFSWRHDEGSPPKVLPEVGGYVVTDRKLQGLMHNVVRPFRPKYVFSTGRKVTEADQKMGNDRFRTGVNLSERFNGQFVNKYRFFRRASTENNVELHVDTCVIFLHFWNIERRRRLL